MRTRAFLDLGGRLIIEGSTGSTPRDCAGGPSIRMSNCKLSARAVKTTENGGISTDP